MARRSSTRREFSIPGDELEQHRIQLEHNLQNTDLSLHLSSVPDDDAGDNESLEYPRHNSAPEHLPGFASFDRHSHENMDLDTSHVGAWSVHDDEGIIPYDVRTMSTAAHHASAVTITAGLTRGGRREPSVSGAEYDPERPLQEIIAVCHASSDVDEADRSQDISRPKLSETLQRAGFSPRRPRTGQSRGSQQSSDPTQRHADANVSRRSAIPRARKVTVSFDTTATPFTRMARGLTRDVRQAQEQWQEGNAPILTARNRPMVKDGTNQSVADVVTDPSHESRGPKKSGRSRVHLPDITGLTNAVISPAKANLERYTIRSTGSKEVEARLVASLNALHTRLNHLETENSIARRRVRELEYELEECKRDVVRERTRIMEDAVDVSAARVGVPSTSRVKGKERRQKDIDPHASKYFEVVQEKKALEALVATLRSHLTRVTSDLSSQQHLLGELRSLRESDVLSLTEKAQEINQLRTEVERLAGEIEVLRGVVERGLDERRQGRDAPVSERSQDIVDHPLHHAAPESPEPSARRFVDDEEIDRISVDLDERRSERASNSSSQGVVEPFPKISSELERLFFSAPHHNATSCRVCKGRHGHHSHANGVRRDDHEATNNHEDKDEGFEEGIQLRPQLDRSCDNDVPPQTVLARVVGELEDEFAHYREVYNSLTEEYKSLDCATQAAKRHTIGDHLRDVIEVLERKGNQIASLYDLLVFKDKPLE